LDFKNIFKISEDKNSLGNKFREKRFKLFFKEIEKLKKPTSILDLGGKINFWENRGLAGNNNYKIIIINIELEKSKYSNIKCKIGDATNLVEFKNQSFDIVHSNSVIEHLHNLKNQKKMASEAVRVGKKYIIQTPNKYFFVEPHYLIPFFQFIPNSIKFQILTKTKISRLKKWDKKFAKQYIEEINLLSLNELKKLFPNSHIYYEKFLGMNKSFTVHNFKSQI
tara:strand:- start:1241 stop:1909 length:669 start_codon:yes stop_codon:yes gene_type:complete